MKSKDGGESPLSDGELLELAAKAAGVPAYWSDDGTIQQRPMFVVKAGGGMGTFPYECEWNSLKDNGIALWLAVKLEIDVDVWAGEVYARRADIWGCYEQRQPDAFAATRRAITRAAAAIHLREA